MNIYVHPSNCITRAKLLLKLHAKNKENVANLLMVLLPFWKTFEPVLVHQPVEDCPCFPNFQSVFFVKGCVFLGKCWCCSSKNGIVLQQNRKFHIFITYIILHTLYYIHLQMLHDPLLCEFTGV